MIATCLILVSTMLLVDSARISASESRVQYGDSVTLSWVLGDAQEAYISHVGRVTGAGSRRISPETTTTYTLVSDNGTLDSISIDVYGSRTAERYPDPEQFDHAVRGNRRIRSLPAFLERTRSYLQDSMRLAVRDGPLAGGGYRFITFPSERVTTTGFLPRQFRARRTAFMVEIDSLRPRGEIVFSIKTFIEYQRRGEQTWRLERDVDVFLSAARALKQALEQGEQ